MSFTLAIRPSAARLLTLGSRSSFRAFHSTSKTALSLQPRTALASNIARNVFKNTFRRGYQNQSYAPPIDNGTKFRKLAVEDAIFGGTLVAVNMVFNRETRTDGSMLIYKREYLNDTFLHTGLNVGITGFTTR